MSITLCKFLETSWQYTYNKVGKPLVANESFLNVKWFLRSFVVIVVIIITIVTIIVIAVFHHFYMLWLGNQTKDQAGPSIATLTIRSKGGDCYWGCHHALKNEENIPERRVTFRNIFQLQLHSVVSLCFLSPCSDRFK